MNSVKKAALAASLLAVPLVAPGGAAAAGNPYNGKRVCGSSYELSRSIPVRSFNKKVLMGRLEVWYSGQTGRSWGVMFKVRQVGRPTYTSVSFVRRGQEPNWKQNDGAFSYYAGPLKIKAVPSKVRIGGYMNVPDGREGIHVEG